MPISDTTRKIGKSLLMLFALAAQPDVAEAASAVTSDPECVAAVSADMELKVTGVSPFGMVHYEVQPPIDYAGYMCAPEQEGRFEARALAKGNGVQQVSALVEQAGNNLFSAKPGETTNALASCVENARKGIEGVYIVGKQVAVTCFFVGGYVTATVYAANSVAADIAKINGRLYRDGRRVARL
jgi:hypothetical protein